MSVWFKMMMVVVIMVGLLFIMWSIGIGLEVMCCIVVFMVGGMIFFMIFILW